MSDQYSHPSDPAVTAPAPATPLHAQPRQTGAQLLVSALEQEGVEVVFGYPGGAIMPFYDALLGSRLRHILVRHEQAAALAAGGYARASGRVGVCVATSGPGAANLLTGVADALLDSVPMVAITGQVPTAMMGTDAFQELDVHGVFMPVVKHSFLVRQAEALPLVVREAFRVAASGRPGPVLIDLPKDVATALAVASPPPDGGHRIETVQLDDGTVRRANELIRGSRRPVIYGGGGIGLARCADAFRRFVRRSGIPTVLTLKGIGALDSRDPLLIGMLGMHGSRAANLAVQAADLLVVVGARFDDRVTGKLATFAPGAKVIHLDIDPAEVGKLRHADVAILGDLGRTLDRLAEPDNIVAWRAACLTPVETVSANDRSHDASISGPALLRRMSELLPDDHVVTCDVGQHQMWVAQHCLFSRPGQHLSSSGLGAMGFGLPAAIGAKLAQPRSTVVNVTGDGSFMMNVQELATVWRYRLPIKILLLNNQSLGMVRQWQDLFFDGRLSEVDLADNPDFCAVAGAFRIPGFSLYWPQDVDRRLREWLAEPGPALLHVPIDPRAGVWPLVPPNSSNDAMIEFTGGRDGAV